MDIIRAWKDEDYCSSLNEEELRLLPENPAGIIELSDEQMECVSGGRRGGRRGGRPVNVDVDMIISVGCTINSHSTVCISNVGGSC